tara:strand:+ start:349 stop:531 length:183 start_codon:yes stop_codon:yes gene_type:complete
MTMNVTSAQYVQSEFDSSPTSIKATIDGQVMFVPISEDNRHYAAILEWAKEDGNEIQAAE